MVVEVVGEFIILVQAVWEVQELQA